MRLTHGLNPFAFLPNAISKKRAQPSPPPEERTSSKEAIAEINAYIAIRDMYLTEAEEVTTEARLHRVSVANDLVATYLKPARSPYEDQHLPEADAARERKRCEAVKARIAKLASVVAGVP
jgi:hypothetical protein